MKKAVNIIVKIISVLLAFSLLTMLFMPKYIEKNVDGRITAEYYREKTPIDIIFVGSSTVQAGLSPMTLYREYGLTAYDRSNSSQVIPVSYAVIMDAIKRNKPELVVLDIGFLYQADDYVDEGSSRKSMDSFKWSKYKSDCINAIMDSSESYTDYVFPILRFHSRWNDLSMEDLKYWIYKPSVTYNGQLLQFADDGKNANVNPYMLDESVGVTERTMAYLKMINNACDDNDVDLLLIKTPMIEGNFNNKIDQIVSDFAEQNGLNYVCSVDSYEEIGLDKNTDFSDGQHMNSLGAEKYSKYIGKYIIDNYSISDRSKDEKVKKIFDKKLQKYEDAMKNKISSEQASQ